MKTLPVLFLGLISTLATAQAETIGPRRTQVVQPDELKESWDGWGNGTGKEETPPPYVKESLTVTAVDPGAERTFKGRVDKRLAGEKLEVGIVSLIGIHWIKKDNYEWSPLAEDGTFSVTSKYEPGVAKAICVRGPDAPWTFYPYDFKAWENGEGLVITLPERRRVTITAGPAEGQFFEKIAFERFTPGTAFGIDGEELRRQQYGRYTSDDKGRIEIVFPAAPIALFLGSPGQAKSYKFIDPREADHFHFILNPAGFMDITVLNPDGTPAKGKQVNWQNPAAPLSLHRGTTDDKGKLLAKDLTPGKFGISCESESQQIEVKPGETTPVNFKLVAKASE
jgi:hypothetical protein